MDMAQYSMSTILRMISVPSTCITPAAMIIVDAERVAQ